MTGCPACGSAAPARPVERHLDRIGGKEYSLRSCADCGVVFSEPREAPEARWYEQAAPLRGLEARPRARRDWRFRRFFADPVPPGRLLDVGCGEGGFLDLARRAGFAGVGFDYDERVVARARALGVEAHAAEFSAFCRAQTPRSFDVVTLFDVLEHVPEPAEFIGMLKRLLKVGGHLAVTLPNALRPLPWGREEHDYPPHHFTRWTPEAMRAFLKRQGFSVIRQDAGHLRLRYLSDQFFFYRLLPPALSAARRLLFGAGAAARSETLTELYRREGAGGALADKRVRQRLVDAARLSFQALSLPAALGLKLYYRIRSPECGDCLYTLARLEG